MEPDRHQTGTIHDFKRSGSLFFRSAVFGSRFGPSEPLLICPRHHLTAAINARLELLLKSQDQRVCRSL